jgi:2-oxoglutarate dehydrogenase E2 component (dihydrolipoamide succinyltransferase)
MARIEVVMPKMGESVMEGTVLTWFKQPGEHVDADETLLEIGTDKVDSEIPSPAEGTLAEILVGEGQTVEVGTVLAVLQTEAEAVEQVPEPATPSEEPVEVASEPAVEEPAASAQTAPPSPATAGIVEVVMPKMGESVMEGTVLTWFKKAGDPIDTDETLLEIGTDKVDSDIPSPASGVLQEILVGEGTTVDVGAVLATIAADQPVAATTPSPPTSDVSQEKTTAPTPETRPASPAPAPVGQVTPPTGDGSVLEVSRRGEDGRFYSPLVRSIARKEGITASELATISGTGREGRVTKQDILSFVSTRHHAAPSPDAPAVTASPRATVSPALRPSVPSPISQASPEGRVEVVEMDRMRQVIAEHMTRSLATSAHVTSFAEADVTNLVKLRTSSRDAFLEREGVKLTYTPFFVKAAVDALRGHPLLNASVDGNRILVKKDFHVGIAVAIDQTKLVVPVIRFAGGMNVSGLAHAAADLAHRARNKQLQPDELQGGTLTVTNVGSLGSIMGTPIINQPQVAILATGAIRKRPVVKEHPDYGDVIVIRSMVYLSLSYDHRIIDGAMAASFLKSVVSNLEEIGPGYDL